MVRKTSFLTLALAFTAVLNLASMGLTGAFIIGQLAQIEPATQLQLGPPPVFALFWLVLALPLASGLFGALSLAIAALRISPAGPIGLPVAGALVGSPASST